jgi:HK97 family phage portal protein
VGLLDDLRGSASDVLREARRWANTSNDDVPLSEMHSALIKAGLAEPTNAMPQSLFYDPYQVSDYGGWRQRPFGLTFQTLNYMSFNCVPIAAIIQTRCNQVGQFCRPQKGRYDKGYRIRLRDRKDVNRSMTPGETNEAMAIERMLETTGFLMPGEKPITRDDFGAYCKKGVRDVLRYDAWSTEIVRDAYGRPSRFWGLPSETIFPAVVDREHMTLADQRQLTTHVQVIENVVISEYTSDNLIYSIMNPRSDLVANGYGLSPVEMAIRMVTAFLYGFDYNQNFFMQGSAQKGLINIKGTIPDRQMQAFRRQWYTMVSGVGNAWKTPILNSDDVQWHSMHTANRDMEFSGWMDWITKFICALFGVDPAEINFQFGNTGQTNSLGSQSAEEKITESKDKGLRPLVEHIEKTLNYMVAELNPDFEFSFAGLDAKSEEKEREAADKECKSYKTINEVRAQQDLPPLPGDRGEAILDPVWIQWVQSREQPQVPLGPDGAPLPGSAALTQDDGLGKTDEDLLSADAHHIPSDDEETDLLSGFSLDVDGDDAEADLLAASLDAIVEAERDVLRKAAVYDLTPLPRGDRPRLFGS